MSTPVTLNLVTEAVVAAYIHELSTQQTAADPNPQRSEAPAAAGKGAGTPSTS